MNYSVLLYSKPAIIHFLQKFSGDRIAGAFSDDGINAAARANCGTAPVYWRVFNDPLLDLLWIKYFQAAEAAADSILFQLRLMVAAVFMGSYIVRFTVLGYFFPCF